MWLLYLDESGDVGLELDKGAARCFILGGLLLEDKDWHEINAGLEEVLSKHLGQDRAKKLELHGGDLLQGRKEFRKLHINRRLAIFKDALEVLARIKSIKVVVVLDKRGCPIGLDIRLAVSYQLCKVLEACLAQDVYQNSLMIICDHHGAEHRFKTLLNILSKRSGQAEFGCLRNKLIENAFFVDSASSRLVQASDLICYAIYRFVTKCDTQLMELIETKIACISGQPPKYVGFSYISSTNQVNFRFTKIPIPPGSYIPVDDLVREINAVRIGEWGAS